MLTKWTEMLNSTLNIFENYHSQKLYFLKESLDADEYIIHPNLIASRWLMYATLHSEKKIVSD